MYHFCFSSVLLERCAPAFEIGTLSLMSTRNAETLLPQGFHDVLPLVVNVAKRSPHDIYIGRSGRGRQDAGWGNPVKVRSNSLKARLEAVVGFWDVLQQNEALCARLDEVAGSTLGCWCAPQLCHGHVIATAARFGIDSNDVENWIEELRSRVAAEPYRLLVTGSRNWQDEAIIRDALLAQWVAWGKPRDAVLVVGGANGADEIAASLWERGGFTVETYPADWDNLGKRAGMVRNAEMISSGVDAALAFQTGDTPGTRHCATAAQKAGVPTTIFQPTR